MLRHGGLSFTAYLTPVTQPSPAPGQPLPRTMDIKPEPTSDRELKFASMNKPVERRTEPAFAPEPKPHRESDQVCEF